MTPKQWDALVKTISGEKQEQLPVGFIIDSPWLPGWAGITTLDYFSSESLWLEANFKAIDTFEEIMFLPGFWSEFGMCTEPSAFGSKCVWSQMGLPHADRIITDFSQVKGIQKPNVKKDGLLPFIIQRLKHCEKAINDRGHFHKFAVSRGPLNIASFLGGTTEFLMGVKMNPEECHKLMEVITDFTIDWIGYQLESFPSMEGILLLDDIIGFIGDEDFKEFALGYLKKIYDSFDVPVKFFHNDAEGLVSAPYLKDIGINFFNFSFKHSITEMKELVGDTVTLLGNVPPRDVLTYGTEDDVRKSVKEVLDAVDDKSRLVFSAGGGMPQDVSTEKINAFIEAVRKNS